MAMAAFGDLSRPPSLLAGCPAAWDVGAAFSGALARSAAPRRARPQTGPTVTQHGSILSVASGDPVSEAHCAGVWDGFSPALRQEQTLTKSLAHSGLGPPCAVLVPRPPRPPRPPPTRRPPVLGGRCLALGEPVDFSSRPSPKAVSERGRSQAQRAPRVTGDPAVRGLPPRCVLCRRRRRERPGGWPAPDGGAWGHHGHSPEPGPGSLGRLLDFLLSERRGQARGRSNTRRPVAAASQGPSLLQTHEMTSNGLPWGKQG